MLSSRVCWLRACRSLLLVFASCAVLCATLFAQVTASGTLAGSVLDPSNAAIPGA